MKEKSTLSSSVNSCRDNVSLTDNDDEDYVEVNDDSPIDTPTLWRHQDQNSISLPHQVGAVAH